ncbi:hypothetical protein K3G63_06730 [Hymenobacter sp. HSC-4F20]|uniref:hypothetical protein n=1 Tax=Hymenobacter sp. HSC-4F20 TaxID=2864135 RepID=UPI001C73CCBE|nr:hypothetical protein [Hymenobacter sp. HSC-4F20]MBX0290126.1 hypothetical protein [Hymenobacter sp. HSC-4F20]
MLKRVLSITSLLFALTTCYSYAQQTLTLDNLIAMQQGGPGAINRTLLPRGWVFKGHDDDQGTSCEFPGITWVYAPSSLSERAVAFLSLMKDEDCLYAVGYQTGRLETYEAIMATITRYGMTQIKSDVETSEDGESNVVEYYAGKNYQVRVSIGSGQNDSGDLKNSYVFTVFRKSE